MSVAVFTGIPMVKADWPPEFEQFGPHIDRILIKLYATESAEFAALEAGEIDLVDWPLTKYWIDRWTGNPEINMMDYGSDLGAFQIDINQNATKPESFPCGFIPGTSEDNIGRLQEFRHAVAHLLDRAWVVTTILQGFGVPIYSMVPPILGGWVNTCVDQHPYSPIEAAAILDAADIKDHDGDEYRDWPLSIYPTPKRVEIDFVVRDDHTPGRKEMGDRLIWELATNLAAYDPTSGRFYVDRWSAWGPLGARKWVKAGKSFTLYTGGWMLSRDPDFLFSLYHSTMYWHPGMPPNYAHVADPELDAYLEGIYYAAAMAEARVNTWEAQRVMAEKCFVIPAYTASAPKAGRTKYTGGTGGVPMFPDDGENLYRGKPWKGFVNQYGFGLNSWWSFLDAHPEGYEVPDPGTNMVLRYGFKILDIAKLNPIYSEYYWDWEVLGKTYDTLAAVNPFDLAEDLEWVAKRWEVRVWTVPETGQEATVIKFMLRDDVYFHDGQQLTSADVLFTFNDVVDILESRGLPPPWWYANVLDIHHVDTPDPYTVVVYKWSKSIFALHQLATRGGEQMATVPILPEHIWRPIVTSGDPETFSPDKQLIGSGPFKAYPHSIAPEDNDYYMPGQYAVLDAFKPGYFNFSPIRASGAVHGSFVSVYVKNYWFGGSASVKVNVHVGAYDLGDQTVSVPPTSTGNVPGVTIVKFDASSLPRAFYSVTVTVDVLSPPWLWDPSPLVFSALVPTVLGDVTNDGIVDTIDALHLSFHFGLRAWVWPEDDLNNDNKIDVVDALVLYSNFGLGSREPAPPGPTTISVQPPMSTGVPEGTFSVDINIIDATDIYSYEFKLLFNPDIITATSITIGDFFPDPPGNRVVKNEIGYDYVWIAVARPFDIASGVTGSGRLATIEFTVNWWGASWLDLTDTSLGDIFTGQFGPVPHTTEDGFFSTVERSLTKTLSPTSGGLGEPVHVTLKVIVPLGETARVVDTLPSEWSYIAGSFKVNGVPATPTVVKNDISYTITASGTYTIEFDAKVTEAYWEYRTVTNKAKATWYDELGNIVDQKEATADFIIHPFARTRIVGEPPGAQLYAGGTRPGVVYRYEGGTAWETISPELGWSVTSLTTYDGQLYASAITHPDISSSSGKVYRYDGTTWTLVGTLDNQVTFLIVYKGELYAGTARPARLYKYIPATTSWLRVIDGIDYWPEPWYGLRSAYVWGDWLYLGDWLYDRFARWDGTVLQDLGYYGGSCIYSFEEYGDYLYAGAYVGAIYRISSAPSVERIWYAPDWRFPWSLKAFNGYLYIGTDANGTGVAPLYKYDGVSFSEAWSYPTTTSNGHEGIISVATNETYLYVGVGGEALGYPGYMSGDGTGRVYRTLDGTTFELISGTLGTGIQTLCYASIELPPPLPLEKYVEGSLTIKEKTETQWTLNIEVTNPFPYTMTNVVITDRLGAELEIDPPFPYSITHGTASYYTEGTSAKVFLTWNVGNLLPGETARLKILISTDTNPGRGDCNKDGNVDIYDAILLSTNFGTSAYPYADFDENGIIDVLDAITLIVNYGATGVGKQEYTTPGIYELNSGATLKFIDPEQDMQLSAVTDSIYVTVLPEEDP